MTRMPWKYTDDIIAGAVVGAWLIGKFTGVDIPDGVVLLTLGYVFGTKMTKA